MNGETTPPLHAWRERVRGLQVPLLEVPLLGKLLGVNVLIALAAVAAVLVSTPRTVRVELAGTLLFAIVTSVVVSMALVFVALRPVRALEETASLVWHGNLEARVPDSRFADRDARRARHMMNLLLDSLTSERARARLLAAQVIRSTEAERARIAGELHDSAAQRLAALTYELSAAARDSADPDMAMRLRQMMALAGDVMEELRALSNSVHSRILDDLGLEPAIRQLARESSDRSGIPTKVALTLPSGQLPKGIASVLYRVAQEALCNAVQHADATSISLTIATTSRAVTMQVRDNGRGFALDTTNETAGLFSMRERVTLANGTFDVRSAPGRGTVVSVSVPLAAAA